MAKKKSVYEVMGNTGDAIKQPEYEVHASKNPQDHFVQQKSVQTRLAEDKGYQAKKLNDAILKTAGQALQSFGSLKTQLDKDLIKIQNHDATMSALKNERDFHTYKSENQEEWNNLLAVDREAKIKEFYEPTYQLVEGMHEDVRNAFAVAHEKSLQQERLTMIDNDALRWYTGKINKVVETLQAFPITGDDAVSQEDFNESANAAFTSLQNITGVEWKVINAEVRKIAIDAIKQDDARLYNFANSLKMYGTGEAYDDGTSTRANDAYEDYQKRAVIEAKKSEEVQLGDIIATHGGSASAMSEHIVNLQTELDQQDNESFKGLIKTVASQISAGNIENVAVLKAMTDGEGRELLSHPVYADEIKELLTAQRLYNDRVNEVSQKEVKMNIGEFLARAYRQGANLVAFDGQNLNAGDPLYPYYATDDAIKTIVHNKIREHDTAQLSSIEDPVERLEYQRTMMQRYQANGIKNSMWSQAIRNASSAIANGDYSDPMVQSQIEQSLVLYQELDKFSPSYISSDEQRATFDAIIAHQELSDYSLVDSIRLAQSESVLLTDVKWEEVLSEIGNISGFDDYHDSGDFTGRQLNLAFNHVRAIMKKGISQDVAIEMVQEGYLEKHYSKVKVHGTDRLVDNRGFKELPAYEQYSAYLGEFITEVEDQMNEFKDEDLQYTLERVGETNSYYFVNERGQHDHTMEVGNGSTIPIVITPEYFQDWVVDWLNRKAIEELKRKEQQQMMLRTNEG